MLVRLFSFVLLIALVLSITVFGQTYDYQAIDEHALGTPEEAEKSLVGLSKYLTEAATNDREKCRAIFRWIANNITYDVESYFFARSSNCSAENILKSRKSVCQGYSSLFEELGKLVGLEVVTVSGYGKGYNYTQGKRFKTTNHAWNAVRIEGRWHLLDVTWGAGHLDNKKYVKSFDETYFLTPPEHFIFDHLPLDTNWQLLEKKISLKEFEDQPHLRPSFFKLGFSVSDVQSCIRDKTFRGFPTLYHCFGKSVFIHQAPLYKHLQSETKQRFVIESADASDVAIINAGNWYYLNKNNDVYSGTVMCRSGELDISLKFLGEGESYWTLLKYIVE